MLLSRAVLDESPAKYAAIEKAGSVHKYLRWPKDADHRVLGDCGAFSYWQEEVPPYKTAEVLEYYQSLGFDMGVSVDHLIFAELEDEKKRRWEITQHNAQEFITLHAQGGYTFQPIGVAQGWDAASYQRAAEGLVKMGYTYIALGGLVRSQTADILRILGAVGEAVPQTMRIHLFGISRPEHAPKFAALGVTSLDSASWLRRAWMDGRRNYFLDDRAFIAIRVPEARALARKLGLDEDEALRREQAALAALRAYEDDPTLQEDAYEAVVSYAQFKIDKLRQDIDAEIQTQEAVLQLPWTSQQQETAEAIEQATKEMSKLHIKRKALERLEIQTRSDYRQTLKERPWQRCPCRICKEIGVEVIIFRGNNRNRRRGFHNTWQLYQQFRTLPQQPTPATSPATATQFEMSLD